MKTYYKFYDNEDYFCKVCKETKPGESFGKQKGIFKDGVERFKCKRCWTDKRTLCKEEYRDHGYRPQWKDFLPLMKNRIKEWEDAGNHLEGKYRWLPIWKQGRKSLSSSTVVSKTLVDKHLYTLLKYHFVTLSKGRYALVTKSEYNKSLGVIDFEVINKSSLRVHEVALGSLKDISIMPYITSRYNVVDHRNGDTLDNRKDNLFAVSQQVNAANRTTCLSTTGYIGVYWIEKSQHFISVIYHDGKHYRAGSCRDSESLAGLVKTRDACKLMMVGVGANNNNVLTEEETITFISLHKKGITPKAAVVHCNNIYKGYRSRKFPKSYLEEYEQCLKDGIIKP